MNLFGGTSSSLTACIVAIAVAASPVMAQTSETTPLPTASTEAASQGSAAPIGDIVILPEVLRARTGAAFPTASRNSTLPEPAASAQPKPSSDVEPGGKSKWVILAALVVTGAVVGIILLLHGGGGGDEPRKPSPQPGPTGTILVPGTPGVTNPR